MNTTTDEPIRKPPSILETERLILRRPSLDDASAIYERYATDPEVSRYMNWTPHRNVTDTRMFIAHAIEQWKSGTRFEYIIECKFTGVLLGMIRLGDAGERGDVGYVLAKRYWGQGYMNEAVKGLIMWGFDKRHWRRCPGELYEDSAPSAFDTEAAGITFEGILRRWMLNPSLPETRRLDCLVYAEL